MYKILFENKTIELPEYSVAIAQKIEALDEVEGSIAVKLQAMYDFIQDIIGAEKTEEALKPFSDADPNLINILFLQIVSKYNEPLEEYRMKEATKLMDNATKVMNKPEMIKSLDAIDKVYEANKND